MIRHASPNIGFFACGATRRGRFARPAVGSKGSSRSSSGSRTKNDINKKPTKRGTDARNILNVCASKKLTACLLCGDSVLTRSPLTEPSSVTNGARRLAVSGSASLSAV